MFGAIAGAGLSALSQIGGAIAARKQAKKAKKQLDKLNRDNENWYRRKMNEDYTQSAEAQRALALAREAAERQMTAARGTQAVMGGTDESVASTQEAVNNGIANTMSSIAAQGTARKDAAESTYLQNKNKYGQMYMDMYNNRANNISQAAGQAAQGFMDFAGADLAAQLHYGKGLFGDKFGS